MTQANFVQIRADQVDKFGAAAETAFRKEAAAYFCEPYKATLYITLSTPSVPGARAEAVSIRRDKR